MCRVNMVYVVYEVLCVLCELQFQFVICPTGPYSLTLTAHPSSEAPTGGEVYLNCSIDSSRVPSELQVEWKLNNIPISSYPVGSFVTTSTGNTHILHVVRTQTNFSGNYTCQLQRNNTVLNTTFQPIDIQPGE